LTSISRFQKKYQNFKGKSFALIFLGNDALAKDLDSPWLKQGYWRWLYGRNSAEDLQNIEIKSILLMRGLEMIREIEYGSKINISKVQIV